MVDDLLSPDGLTKHTAVFTRRDITQALCEHLPDADAATILRVTGHLTAPSHTRLVALDHVATPPAPRDGGGDQHRGASRGDGRYTTQELLATEAQIFTTALRRRSDHAGLAPEHTFTAALAAHPGLSDEQQVMVRRLCGDGDGIAVVVGKAGSGKTAALAAAHFAWNNQPYPHMIGQPARQYIVSTVTSNSPSTSPASSTRMPANPSVTRSRPVSSTTT